LSSQLKNLQVRSDKIIQNHKFTIKTLESDLEQKISDKNLKISTQENLILSQKVEIKQLQLDFTEQTSELEALADEKETVVSSLASANDRISEITTSKLKIEQNFEENLKQKLDEKLKPYQNAKNEIDSYQEVLDMKNKKIRDLIEKLAVAEECSREQLEVKIVVNDMKVNEKRLHEEISEWAEKHRAVERKMAENDSRMMSFKHQNAKLVQDLEQSQFRLQNISDYESEVTRLNDYSGLSNNSFGELPTGDGASTPVKNIQLDFSSSGRSSLREPIMSPGIDRIPLTPNRSNFNPSFEPSAELHNTSIGGSLMLSEESSTMGRK
jgi:chromosome segregation ATPase